MLGLFKASKTTVDVSEIREFLRGELLTSCRDEYKDRSDIWRGLETKAQGNIAIAGIFIAGVFAFLRDVSGSADLVERALLGLTVITLVGSVVLSVRALRVQDAPPPPMAAAIQPIWEHLDMANHDLRNRLWTFLRDYSDLWCSANAEMKRLIGLKASHVSKAQALMVIAVLLVAALTLVKIFAGGHSPALHV